jgi:flagellar biosynthetic protein FliQ
MDTGQIVDIVHRALYIAVIVAAPVLIVSLAVGIFISIFQAATQIHEQSLTFVPKIIAVVILLLVAGGWMITQIEDFTKEAFNFMANI